MAPRQGLCHLDQYEIEGSNVEFIGSNIDHEVKYNSAATEPAWQQDGGVGQSVGLNIWRIEQFEVVVWPKNRYGSFHEGDSYIVLRTFKSSPDARDLSYDLFFWLGKDTTQDEAGTAAYKTVELDEFLHGAAVQYREIQGSESSSFLSLFPRLTILRGGAATGFRHVETAETSLFRLLQITSSGGSGVIVREVDPTWKSLNEGDVFVLDQGEKITSWQGKSSSPMEKMKAATAIAEMVDERQGKADVEVLAQTDSRSLIFIRSLGGDIDSTISATSAAAAPAASASSSKNTRRKRLFRCSDSTGTLSFDLVKNDDVALSDFQSDDVFLFDSGFQVYVWEGSGASKHEKAAWLKVAESYLRSLDGSWTTPVASVKEGREGPAFQSVLIA
jgi:gelsolin